MPLDRLAALLPGMSVEAAGLAVDRPNLHIARVKDGGFYVGPYLRGQSVFSARLSWGPAGDRLWQGMTGMTVTEAHVLYPVIALSVAEAEAPRCGADHLLKGYVQTFVVHLMRQAIEEQTVSSGVLAGLADPRLARVLVALHEQPSKPWKVEAMAELAGMSRSAFMARFTEVLGEAPATYLRRFRMERARAELDAGGRVGVIARRYGYASPDAFTRAMKAQEQACA